MSVLIFDSVVPPNPSKELQNFTNQTVEFQLFSTISTMAFQPNKYNKVILGYQQPIPSNLTFSFPLFFETLLPNGTIDIRSDNDISLDTMMAGFTNVSHSNGVFTATKPDYSFNPALLETQELIDDDALLDDDDLQRPDPSTLLPECGTTTEKKKKKACKNCSCGLAEIEAAEHIKGKSGEDGEAKEMPKSSCGSCYLGDAFRCDGCPYRGMPAFKPGETVTLADSFLQDDI